MPAGLAPAPLYNMGMALPGTSPITTSLRSQISMWQTQLDLALSSYASSGSSASLLSALKVETQIVSALLSATGLATPTSGALLQRINLLR